MQKNDSKSIELEKLNMESVLDCMGHGSSIVFVTESSKLAGAMTEGDINRCFRSGQYTVDETMVNRNIHYIVDNGNSDKVFDEAEEIFKKFPKIHNIPVVDKAGIFLYQIDRQENVLMEYMEKHLTMIEQYKSLAAFMECYQAEHIVLAGGEDKMLNRVKSWFEVQLARYDNTGRVVVSIAAGMGECRNLQTNAVVICLSDIVTCYLNMAVSCDVPVISIKEIYKYYFYKELEQIHIETITNFLELFGYDVVCFKSKNLFTKRMMRKLEQCEVKAVWENEKAGSVINGTDIYVSSMDTYEEMISLDEWNNILRFIQQYTYIAKTPVTREKYIEEYINCLAEIEKEGIEGFIFEPYNSLDLEVYKKIEQLGKFRMIRLGQEKNAAIQWMNLTKKLESEIDFKLLTTMRCSVLEVMLVNACYDVICGFCNNVYIHRLKWDHRIYSKCIHPGRVIENFMENREKYFSADFVETMYGDKDFPVEQLLLDLRGCEVYRVNEGYEKYQSNYVSEYFNTDTYGCRVTADAPEDYAGTIWMAGACLYAGYAVPDCDTIASVLQKKLNGLGINYRVVNFSLGGSAFYHQINRMCEVKMGNNDIVLCYVGCEWNRGDNDNIITIDADTVDSQIQDDEYWNYSIHCGAKGYTILAEQILRKIKPKLVIPPKNKFHLESGLEKAVAGFITDIKKQIREKQMKSASGILSVKSGAIVMNCNPFTYGHQYLVETASRMVDILYIFVVEEDKSVFPFADRLRMVQEGVEQFSNVVVLPSGKFMISSVTFPGYFMKENPTSECYDSFLDLKIFAHYIAPELNISKRFVGEEPFDKVTAQYNHDMKIILGEQHVDVIEIPRKRLENEVISATKVRKLMAEGDSASLQRYVPETTVKYLTSGPLLRGNKIGVEEMR